LIAEKLGILHFILPGTMYLLNPLLIPWLFLQLMLLGGNTANPFYEVLSASNAGPYPGVGTSNMHTQQ